jgi:hypothetical protein
MFIGAGAGACCADAMALEAKIARATAAGPRHRKQILADQHVISTSSPAVPELMTQRNGAILGEKIERPPEDFLNLSSGRRQPGLMSQ